MKELKLIKLALQVLCAFTLCMLVVILAMQLVNRNFIGYSFVWVEELAGISMIYLTFLGSALATLNNGNTRIDFFIRLLPPKGTIFFNILSNVVSIGFLVVLGKYTFRGIINNTKNLTPAMRLPVSVEYAGMMIGLVLMSIFFIIQIFFEVQKYRNKDITAFEEALK